VRVFVDFFRERIGEPPYWDRGLTAPDVARRRVRQ
jgi:hypothetical protein